jgi:hypothetical protein
MTQQTATPGPWTIVQIDGVLYVIPSGRAGEIAALQLSGAGHTPKEQSANADLIRAAPALRDALRALVIAVEDVVSPPGEFAGPERHRLWTKITQARAALASAEPRGKGEG